MFQPFRMSESASNLCWYPLYSPTCTNSDLLLSTEHLHLETSNNETQDIIGMSNASNISRTGHLHRHLTEPTSLGKSVIEFSTTEQTRQWQRKLSDCGTAAGGN